MIKITLIIVIAFWFNFLNGNNRILERGLPIIKNYSPEEYKAHGQNWAIIQDRNGFMYFGNTDGGVLQCDGVSWRQIPVSNGSIVRSLAIDSAGIIYVGAQNEFGYLAPDSIGNLQYILLKYEIESSYRNFGDVWQMHATANHLYFSTRKYLFRRDSEGNYKVWEPKTTFHVSFLIHGKELFVHQMKIGGEDDDFIPKEFALKQNYPNPFNPSTTIEYNLPKAAQVKIEIFNLLGKKVKTLVDTYKNAGRHKFIFDSNNLASGVYLYRIEGGKYTNSKKMILLR